MLEMLFFLSKFNNCNPRKRKELLLFSEKEAIRDGDRGEGNTTEGRNWGKMSSRLELSKREIDTPRDFSSPSASFFHAFAGLTGENLGLDLQQKSVPSSDNDRAEYLGDS